MKSKFKYYIHDKNLVSKIIKQNEEEEKNNIKKINKNYPQRGRIKRGTNKNVDLNNIYIKNPTINENMKDTQKELYNDSDKNIGNNKKKDKNEDLFTRIKELEELLDKKEKEIIKKDEKLRKYLDTYEKVAEENEENKKRIENLQDELNVQKNDNEKKNQKIAELTLLNDNLTNENKELQKNFDSEFTDNKQNKQNYDMIKRNYTEMKNQYELLNMKYQTLSDELFNVKRDKLLYEREIKTLNDDNELLNSIKNKNNYDSDEKKENNENENNNDDENNQNDDDFNKKNVIPQNKPDKIQYYKNKIAEFNKERDDLNNIFNKMPSRPRKKEQIEKKKELEEKIAKLNNDLANYKIVLKSLTREDD